MCPLEASACHTDQHHLLQIEGRIFNERQIEEEATAAVILNQFFQLNSVPSA